MNKYIYVGLHTKKILYGSISIKINKSVFFPYPIKQFRWGRIQRVYPPLGGPFPPLQINIKIFRQRLKIEKNRTFIKEKRRQH